MIKFNNKQLGYPLSGSFTGSFSGDGSQLTNLPVQQINSASFVTTGSFNTYTASIQEQIDSLTNTTSSYITNVLTSSMTVLSSSYALTASYLATYTPPFPYTGSAGISGSLTITGQVSASQFAGNGANLTNIPAAAIVGLNLSQITSGSVSASISPNLGLRINTYVTATSFTGSLFGTSSYASQTLSSSFASTASLAPLYVLTSATSSMLSPYVLTNSTASMLQPYIQASQTSSMSVLSSSFATTASYISPTFISASAAASGFGAGGGGGSNLFGVTVDGQGGVINIGDAGYSYIPTARNVSGFTLIADRTGSIIFDLKVNNTSIIGAGNYPTLTTSSLSSSATPTGWTSTSLSAGTLVNFNIISASLLTRVNLFVY